MVSFAKIGNFLESIMKKNVFLGKKTDVPFVVGKNDKEKQKQNHYPEIG